MRFHPVLGLVLAAVLVTGGCGRRAPDTPAREEGGLPAPDTVLARVGSREITEADVRERLASMPALSRVEFGSRAGRQRLVRQLVEEELLWRAAHEEGVAARDSIRHLVELAERDIVVQAYLDAKQAEISHVTDEEARAFYEEHAEEYVSERLLRVRVFQNPDSAKAYHAHERATDNMPMETVCNLYSELPAIKENNGLLPQWVRPGRAVPWLGNIPRFHAVLDTLTPRTVSEMFPTPRGWLFVRIEDARPPRQRTLEEVRRDVDNRIVSARQREGLPALLAELEDRYEVQVVELPGAPEAVFAEAQAAADPREAVARYEELVERWPDHERVPEALFMIGFKRSEELSDPEGAEQAFRRLLEEFPDSELAQSARWMLSSEGNGSPPFGDASAGEPEESTP